MFLNVPRVRKVSQEKVTLTDIFLWPKITQVIPVHEETKTFKCKKCDKGFTRKYCLKKHMAGVHAPGKLPSKCNICNASFADAQYKKDGL